MQPIKDFKIADIPHHKILIAVTSEPDYEMSRVLIVEDYPEWSKTTVVNGGHCSCYGFDETSWDATIYENDEMKPLMEGWLTSYDMAEREVARVWFATKQ
jgi:hypothetical protein